MIDRPKRSALDGVIESERLQNLQSIQVYLLRYALLNFPNVEKVVYSTCSVYPEENEQVIDEVLSNVGDAYHLVPIKDILKGNWLNFSSSEYNCGDKCLYAKPDVDLCNGFFVAMFKRNFDVPLPECKRKGGNVNLEQLNLDTEKSNKTENDEELTEKVSRKKKKRGKKKNKGASLTIDEQAKKTLEHASEFGKNEEAKDGKIDVSLELKDDNNGKAILNELVETTQDEKLKKTGKKRKLKDTAFQIEDNIRNKEIIETCDDKEMEQNEEDRIISPKKKKKKKKENKEMVEIDDVQILKENEQTEFEPVNKKKKTKKKHKEIVEINDDEDKE